MTLRFIQAFKARKTIHLDKILCDNSSSGNLSIIIWC